MLETLQSLPLWLFFYFALLLVALAWWQAPRIRPQLIGFGPPIIKNLRYDGIGYWSWRLLSLFLVMLSALVFESIIKYQSTMVFNANAGGKEYVQPIPTSYNLERRLWQLGVKPLPKLITVPAVRDRIDHREGHSELPLHEASTNKNFMISQHEITFKQYDYFIWLMHENGLRNQTTSYTTDYRYPNSMGLGRGKRPVINLSRKDREPYVNWLSKEIGQRCSLLSQEKWKAYSALMSTDIKNGKDWNYNEEGFRVACSSPSN